MYLHMYAYMYVSARSITTKLLDTWRIHYDQGILILGYKNDMNKIQIYTNLCLYEG